jgi:DNA-binding PadR family transcriptional regulator
MRMAEVTTLGYALLGLLAREPLSGYDLARLMRTPVGFFWHARHSQIYPELARLQAHGYVTYEVVPQRDRPDKKVYTITDAGRELVREWAMAPLETPTVRDELVLKAFSLWLTEPRRAAALFREHERRHLAQLAEYREIEASLRRANPRWPGLDSPDFASYVTLQRGIGYEREYAAWCRWVAEQLERGPQATVPAGPREGEADQPAD